MMPDELKTTLERALERFAGAGQLLRPIEEIRDEVQALIARKRPELSAMRCPQHPDGPPIMLRANPQTREISADLCDRCFSIWTEAFTRAMKGRR